MAITASDRMIFHDALIEFDKMEEEYNKPIYNAFGERLVPHYCVHGIANNWSPYDDMCWLCENGTTRAEYAMYMVREHRRRVERHKKAEWILARVAELKAMLDACNENGTKFGDDYYF